MPFSALLDIELEALRQVICAYIPPWIKTTFDSHFFYGFPKVVTFGNIQRAPPPPLASPPSRLILFSGFFG